MHQFGVLFFLLGVQPLLELIQPDVFNALDKHYQTALTMMTSPETKKVFEIEREDKKLRRLEIDSIVLEEADLVHLAQLTKLEILGQSCKNSKTRLTDRGIAHVSRIR